jgi:hypothetical protein
MLEKHLIGGEGEGGIMAHSPAGFSRAIRRALKPGEGVHWRRDGEFHLGQKGY